jgi:hypothetical protein
MLAGTSTSDSTPPSDSASVKIRVEDAKAFAAATPPASSNETIPPDPDIWRSARARCGCEASPG